MTHAEMDDLYDLYALGVLEPELAAEIETHLDDNCSYCVGHMHDASNVVAALANVAESVDPPRRLRGRVLAAIATPKRSTKWSFAFLVLGTACAALLVFSAVSLNQMRSLRDQLNGLRRERNELRVAVQLLSKSETRTVEFGKSEDVPHGRVLLNPSGGLVFVGSQLPALAAGKTFELWVIPAGGVPQAAGLFRPDSAGASVNVSTVPFSSEAKAVAVTIEPAGGSKAPTTKPFLVVPLAS